MPERLWNMLKLVPGISASRKNSLITGLARIDENTDELILSVYHLPEPTEFLDDKRATYYAWYYDNQKETWGRIGELQSKNNLTYSLKKRSSTEGNGVFITVETRGREPKEPGEIIIASDPELFYKNLNTEKTPQMLRTEQGQKEEQLSSENQKTLEQELSAEPLVEQTDEQLVEERSEVVAELKMTQEIEEELILTEPDELTDRVEVEEAEEREENEGNQENEDDEETEEIEETGDIVKAEAINERVCEDEFQDVEQSDMITPKLCTRKDDQSDQDTEQRPTLRPKQRSEQKPKQKPKQRPKQRSEQRSEYDVDSTSLKIDHLKGRFLSLYDDLQGDTVLELLKNRYSVVKDEIDIKHYWNQAKDYMHDLYEALELDEIYEEIQDDLQELLHRIDLESFWDKIEDLIKDLIAMLEVDEWVMKVKCWVDDLDFAEMYCKAKKYLDAMLDVVDVEKVWYKVKCWLSDLLNQMDVDEMMLWIKIKIYQMREMNSHQLKAEMNNILSRFVDDLKMPELKMAVLRVALKDKVEQVGSFFKHLKTKVDLTNDSSPAQLPTQDTEANLGFDPQITYQKPKTSSYQPQMNQNRSITQQPFVNRNQQAYYNPNQAPYASPYMPFYPQRDVKTRHESAGQNQSGATYYSPAKNPYYSSPTQVASMSNMYNPYIFKSGQGSSYMANNTWGSGMFPQQQVTTPYSACSSCYYNCPCMQCWQYYQNNFRVDNDALGEPRYFYDEADEYYYFITPDGELVRKS